MRATLTPVVAALASVTVILSSAIPEAGGSDVAVSAPLALKVYHDDDFVGTPEEIYAKANARLASLGLEKRGELVAKNKNTYSTNPALHYMEGYVGDIIDHCSFTTIAGQLAGGQMFDTGRYNVILRGGQGLTTDCAYGPWKQ
ncbi:hypothetical protein F5882DRAFT_467212 [Hyaloscypha sp. PMI_1271]|nr:hypothetical protein F5882DRAFT_467212 [Hyaloscypha sp. PMI_1271]